MRIEACTSASDATPSLDVAAREELRETYAELRRIGADVADLGLRLEAGRHYDLANFDDEAMLERAAEDYYRLGKRRGLRRDYAAAQLRRNGTLIAAMLVQQGALSLRIWTGEGPSIEAMRTAVRRD